MKKVLFLQIKGKSCAGVWNVNKLIGEGLLDANYEVHIVSIRNNQINIDLEHRKDLIVKTINESDVWESYHLVDVVNELKKLHLIKVIKMILSKIKYKIGLQKDVKELHKYIYKYNPDYIITTHYQLLDMIPKKYLSKTLHEQHSSFDDACRNKANIKTFEKYKDKIKFIWLTQMTMENAIKKGYKNSTYIYNAVRFISQERANVTQNKKMIAIARLSKDKSLDVMIDIVEDIFKDKKYKDWILEIYGHGTEEENLKQRIVNKKQIKLMGLTSDPKKELLNASIHLNTSKFEGFSLSILEANECGVPTIAFNYGESTNEQIYNNKTGIIAKDIEDYKNKLKELMDNLDKLQELSLNAKDFSKKFHKDKIIQKWIDLFEEMDND